MIVPYFDITYLLFSLPAILIGLMAQMLLSYWTNKYRHVGNAGNLTGIDAVERIAKAKDLQIRLETTPAELSDNYNPQTRTLTISDFVAHEASIASVGIAAHELGHAMQHKQASLLFNLRTAIVPLVSIGTSFGYILLIMGILIGLTQLAWVGIILFSSTTLFSLVTLPVELDASRRALNMISETQLLYPDEIPGVRKVLFAAALTYVAGTLQSLGALLYFIFRVQGMSGKRK